MKYLFAPARYKMGIPSGAAGIAGGLILPAGIQAPTLIRRDLTKKYPYLRRRLFDPQLYLAELPPSSCRKVCVNLASYGWFRTNPLKRFDSAKQTQSEWKKEAMLQISKLWTAALPQGDSAVSAAIAQCIQTQANLGCEAIILPSPLTADLSSDFSLELAWLDRGLALAQKLGVTKPCLATVALSDTCLRGMDPWRNELLTVVIDQITARSFQGVYIVIEQSNENGYYCAHPNTVGALLRLSYQFRQGGLERIVVGPTGIAGFLAVSAGADTWTTGWYRGERRVRLSDYEDQTGMAVPTYYSHKLAGEIHTEEDLDRLNKRGLVQLLGDETPVSKRLLQALRAGRNVASVLEWKYGRSNVSAATEHFLYVAARETATLAGKTEAACLAYARDWLSAAEELASKCYAVGGFNPRTELNHQAAWRQAFDNFLGATGAL